MKRLLIIIQFIPFFCFAECDIIYVSTDGSINGNGSIDQPYDIFTAFEIVEEGNTIRIASGQYFIDMPLEILANNIIIEGGFNSLNEWKKSSALGALTQIIRNTSNIEGDLNEYRLTAFQAFNKSGFEFHDLYIEVLNMPFLYGTSGGTTYGLYLSNCSNYSIIRTKIIAGNGGSGQNGSGGISGSNGQSGGGGGAGNCDSNSGGIGGSGASLGGYNGGYGGNGGYGSNNGNSGFSGINGGVGGAGGTGGLNEGEMEAMEIMDIQEIMDGMGI